jgi:hypothetical protein
MHTRRLLSTGGILTGNLVGFHHCTTRSRLAGAGVGVSPSLSPRHHNRLGQHLGDTPPAGTTDSIEESSQESVALSWGLNLEVDSMAEDSIEETASQDLEAKKQLANAQQRIAKHPTSSYPD